jgi:adenylosuccinate lyase
MAVARMQEVVGGLGVIRESLNRNLADEGVLAEPAYILLAESGVSDAHEVIRKITLRAEQERVTFAEALSRDPDVLKRIAGQMLKVGLIKDEADACKAALDWFSNPAQYRGLAAKKARELAVKSRELMKE